MRKKGDVKFIIYQSLYILVICIIAIKGANLDLIRVMESKDMISDDSLRKLYEAIKTLRFVDTTQYVIIDRKVLEENEKLAELYRNQPPIPDISGMIRLSSNQRIVSDEDVKKLEEIKEKPKEQQEVNIGDIILYQYHDNSVTNRSDISITVNGVTISPHATGTVRCGGDASVMVSATNGASRNVPVRENKPPQIQVQQMAQMGPEAKISALQSTVGFRVTIVDDFPDQVDVTISGPVTKKEVGSKVYDVYLNYIHSKDEFDRFTSTRGDAPYQVAFTINVSDRIAPHKVSKSVQFVFGDW